MFNAIWGRDVHMFNAILGIEMCTGLMQFGVLRCAHV